MAKYEIPITFILDIEESVGEVIEIEKLREVLQTELGYCVGDFDFIVDAIAERIEGELNSISVKKPKRKS